VDKPVRPKVTSGVTKHIDTPQCGDLRIIINLPWEVFCTMGNPGGCQNSWAEALARSITLGIVNGIPVEEYIEQLKDIKCSCPSVIGLPEDKMFWSCPDAVARQLQIVITTPGNGST
jgi:hypothetical protein